MLNIELSYNFLSIDFKEHYLRLSVFYLPGKGCSMKISDKKVESTSKWPSIVLFFWVGMGTT